MENAAIKEKQIRIGIDGRVLQDPKPSGIPSYAKNIIDGILKLDKKNKYIIFYNSFRGLNKEAPKFSGNVEEKVFHYPNKFLEWFWKIIPYPKIDRLLGVDIFYSPHFINIPLSKETKKVVTIHDLSFLKNKRYFSLRKNLWHWQMNPKNACKSFDKIIAVSETTKNDIINLYKIDDRKIRVIYNGSRKIIDFYDSNKEAVILDKFGLEKKKYILFLATLEPRKNIEGIIDAFAITNHQHKDHKLVIAGKKGWLFKNIFRKVLKYGLQNKIIFTDFIGEKEKHILFKNTALFIFPSFCEGFGIPLIEARNYGLPTITSNTSSMPEVVKDSALMVNPHNIREMAIATDKVLDSAKLKSILKRNSQSQKDSSWQKASIETLEYILS